MRKRTAATGVGAVGLIALGLMYLPDFDFGSLGVPAGDGTEVTLDPTNPDQADEAEIEPAPTFDGAPVAADDPADPADGMAAGGPDGGPAAEESTPLAVVDVLVDGGEYFVLRRFASDGLPIRDPMTLSGVLDLASRVPGDAAGLKVRISRTPDAIAGATDDLRDALRNAGFEEDQVDYRLRLVEDAGGLPGEGGFDGGPRPSAVQ